MNKRVGPGNGAHLFCISENNALDECLRKAYGDQ